MPRLLNFRALCAGCEKAEARSWCVRDRRPLCSACASARGARAVPIVSRTVVTALCSHCAVAPAAVLAPTSGASLCQSCGEKRSVQDELVPLNDAAAVQDIVFDRMDFSSVHAARPDAAECAASASARNVDMSYYQTKVPAGLVRHRKRAAERDITSTGSPTQRRR
ncbi:hypothetical protein BWQ96_09789 [Gracilariopsis chorda]|uniref:B box-type domain-containing protein n=1 Tax=Gracilariopsis chorda TaxID=448386 RepID=A0A2V3IER5_9FLOR|nr:hypothetical protein BWQ96_09789 [Gracilariopsis chorda]|eukprot:PXF40508.1 hypothetical protein BWQ96_09789 [Gracilariopsis chorda]